MSRGRPVGWRKAEPNQRKHQQLRAFDDEFELIKEFMHFVREVGVERARQILDEILLSDKR